MSITKRNIEDLQDRGITDAEYDACYAEYLRDQERDMAAERFFEENPEVVTVLRSDDIMPVTKTKTEVKSEEKKKKKTL